MWCARAKNKDKWQALFYSTVVTTGRLGLIVRVDRFLTLGVSA